MDFKSRGLICVLSILLLFSSCASTRYETLRIEKKETNKYYTKSPKMKLKCEDSRVYANLTSKKYKVTSVNSIKHSKIVKEIPLIESIDPSVCWLFVWVTLPVFPIWFIKAGEERPKYREYNQGSKKLSPVLIDSNYPLKNKLVTFSSSNRNVVLANRRVRTNSYGNCEIDFSTSKMVLNSDDYNWSNNMFKNINPEYYNVTAKYSGVTKRISVGPFKDISSVVNGFVKSQTERIFNKYFCTLTLNVMDNNTHRSIKYVDVKINLPKDNLLRQKISKIARREISKNLTVKTKRIKELIISSVENDLFERVSSSSTVTTDYKGRASFCTLKQTCFIEFTHDDYYWCKHKFSLKNKTLNYNIFMSDVGSKVRVEKVKDSDVKKGYIGSRN